MDYGKLISLKMDEAGEKLVNFMSEDLEKILVSFLPLTTSRVADMVKKKLVTALRKIAVVGNGIEQADITDIKSM